MACPGFGKMFAFALGLVLVYVMFENSKLLDIHTFLNSYEHIHIHMDVGKVKKLPIAICDLENEDYFRNAFPILVTRFFTIQIR